jgi:CCR4-NOT transcription complex subunit 7/8
LAAGFGGNASLGGSGGSGLASHAAVMGFARGDAIQQQQQQSREAMRRGNGTKAQNKSRIRDVWAGNLHQEMQNLRELVERYPFIGMVSLTGA